MNHQYKTSKGEFTSEDEEALEAVKYSLIDSSGFVQVYIGKPKRTAKQNRAIHAFFNDLSVELNGLGVPLSFGKGIEASWTPETAKEIFFKVLYLAGKNTSECLTDELAKAVDACIRDVNMKGGQLSIKEPLKGRKTLSKKRVEDILQN